MALKGNKIVTLINLEIENIGPLHIGNGEEALLLDKNTNKPYIPGTGIAGAIKAYIYETKGEYFSNKYLGVEKEYKDCNLKNSKESKIYIYDSYLVDESKAFNIELRPGLRIDGFSGTNADKAKFDIEYLSKGNIFNLKLKLYSEDEDEYKEGIELIYDIISAIDKAHIRFGGLKTSGSGEFKVKAAKELKYDLSDKKQLFNYLLYTENYTDITNKINKRNLVDKYAEFTFECKTKGPILVKGQASNSNKKADSEPIKNGLNEFIVPGSSFKGVLHSRCLKILDYLNKKELAEYIFGYAKDKDKAIGRLYFSDIVIKNDCKDKSVIYNRIMIDKFTGGVKKGALMTEETTSGEMKTSIKYKLSLDSYKDDCTIALIALALRDMANENLPIGSEYSTGKGIIKGKKLTINYSGKEIKLDFINDNYTNAEFLQPLIEKLNK